MVYSQVQELFGKSLKHRQTLHSLLLEWNGNSLSITRSLSSKIKFYIGVIHTFIYSIFLVYQLISVTRHSTSLNSKDYVDCLWILLWCLYYIWSSTMYINYIQKSDEQLAFLKGLIKLNVEYAKYQGVSLSTHRSTRILEMILDIMGFSFTLGAACMAVMLSTKPEFISVLVPHEWHNWPFLFLLFLFEFYSVGVTVGAISFTSFYQSMHMILSYYWMKQIKMDETMSIDEKIKHFRKLQILNTYFNHSYTSSSHVASLTTFFIATIWTFFGAIRFHFITSFFEYALFPFANISLLIVFTILMYGSASVYSSSTKLVQFIRKQELLSERRVSGWKKFRKSKALKPFGVSVGTFGVVQKTSLLMVYDALSNYSTSLLITFPYSYFSK